jgi:hypothetical protein
MIDPFEEVQCHDLIAGKRRSEVSTTDLTRV